MSNYLITGAGSDLSKAVIEMVAKPGDYFFLQSFKDGDSLKEYLDGKGIRYEYHDVDLSNREDTDRFVSDISSSGIRFTHYIHFPALRVVNTRFRSFDTDRFLRDMNVQVLSAAKISKVVVPQMAKAKFGRVVFVATSYILANPPKNTAAYIMAKSALAGLAKSMAVDFRPNGVTVNCVSPSMIETKFLAETSHIIVEAARAEHPMKRNATVDDVAPAIAFLLSEEARFITGVNLPITGGSVIE